ncbi:MAG: nuclear transport factor 2 family protein [Nocardioides alkalitolerans]
MTHRGDIEDVLNRYAHAYDDRDAEGVGATFAEDGQLSLRIGGGDLVGPWVGRAAVVEMMAATLATQDDQRRHLASTFTLDACDGGTARARSYLTLVAVAGGELRVLTTGRYVDELVDVDGAWLIRSRHIELDLPY